MALGIAALINFAVISTFAEQFFHPDCASKSIRPVLCGSMYCDVLYCPVLSCAGAVLPLLSLSVYRLSLSAASTTSACIAENENFQHDHYGVCEQANNGAAGFCQVRCRAGATSIAFIYLYYIIWRVIYRLVNYDPSIYLINYVHVQHIGLSDADTPLKASLGNTAGLIWASLHS